MGRRLGQHFLFDPAILDRIVDALHPDPRDFVVEIGAGRGTLTKRLAPRVGSVVTIERDAPLASSLQAELADNCTLKTADALEVEWAAGRDPQAPYKVVGNIPYAITTPLLDKALDAPLPDCIVFLLQREVGDRLSAAPGTKAYGGLTVGVQTVAAVERLFVVRPGSFRPPPKVESVVVRLIPLAEPIVPVEDRWAFRRFVTGLFGQRRRQLTRALRTVTGLSAEAIQDLIGPLGLAATARPEVLTPHEFAALFAAIPR